MTQRLAFFIHELNPWGGQERCTLELVRRLSRRWPIDVHALTMTPEPGGDATEPLAGVRFWPVSPSVNRPILARSIAYHAATWPRLRSLRNSGRALIHSAGACTPFSDVVQVHCVHAAWRDRDPNASTDAIRRAYHGVNDAYNLAFERRVFRTARGLVAVSQRTADDVREYLGVGSSVEVVHHGVDLAAFRPATDDSLRAAREQLRTSLGVGPEEIVIGFVGSFELKNLDVLIEALARCSPELRRRARVVALGRGSASSMQQYAEQLGVGDRVSVLGARRNVADYYRAFDLFAFPTPYDAFGMVVLESMASGVPVIVSKIAGASELLDADAGQLLADPEDADELAAALERYVQDDELRQRAGRHARALAEQHSWDRVAERYAEVLSRWMA